MSYGDMGNVRTDMKTLKNIISRQGVGLVNDMIAESIGETVLKFKLNTAEATRIRESVVNELKEAINERI